MGEAAERERLEVLRRLHGWHTSKGKASWPGLMPPDLGAM